LELRDQIGLPTWKVCYFYTKNTTRPGERKYERKERKWKGEMVKRRKNSVGVKKSCKTRTFPRIKEKFNFRIFPLMHSNPDVAPNLRSAHECL